MAAKGTRFRFVIDAFTPQTLPMARLAEYLEDLASLLGEKPNVHFLRVEEGTARAVYIVDSVAVPKVEYRLKRVKSESVEEPEVARAYRNLNDRLASDNAVGRIERASGAPILRFPGRDTDKVAEVGPITQRDELDGEIVSVGGETDRVHVHIRTRSGVQNCTTKKPIAKDIARYLYGQTLRVHGKARWFRDSSGDWQLFGFVIDSFDPLKETPLSEVAEDLQNIQSGIAGLDDDPEEALRKIRHGDDTTH